MSDKYKNVLVIDDEEEIVNAARRMLERSGYDVDTALNGKQGMDLVNKSRPDVVITDIIMPIMDGYEFFKSLKRENLTSDIPVIILTARPNMEDSFRALGVEGFLTKPFTGDSLVNKIKQLDKKDLPLKDRGTILVCGSDEYALNHMLVLLKDDGYNADTLEDGSALITKAIEKVPDFIFMDIDMEGLPARELIKALRCFHKLDNTQIILYTNFIPNEKNTFSHVDYLQGAKKTCMEAGANHYIGRFSNINFIDQLNNIKNSL